MSLKPQRHGTAKRTTKLNLNLPLPIGPKVVPFGGSYLEFYKVTSKRNYSGAYGWLVGNGGMGYNYNYYYYHSSIPY